MRLRIDRRRPSSVGTSLVLWCVCCGFGWLAPVARAAPTVSELTTAIGRQRDAFFAQKSYKFTFQITSEVSCGKEAFAYKSLTVTNVRRGSDLHTTVLYPKGSLRGQENLPQYTRHLTYFQKAGVDGTDYVMQLAPAVFTQHYTYHQYTDYQHINVYKDLPAPAGNLSPYEITQPFLPETVESSARSYRVRPAPEDIDGASCWVLERPAVDVIWVDTEGLIHQRLLYWGKGQPRSVVTKILDYKPVAPGLKLPMKIIVDHFTNPSSDPKEIWDQLSYELTIVLKSHEFNTAKDADFIVKPAVGCTVNDFIRRVQYRVPAPGEKPFETALAIASLEQTPRSYYIILVNGLLFGLILIAVLTKKIRTARRVRAQAGAA